jgi:hypothetical protein
MSTLVYGDDRLAMYIDDVQRTSRVTFDRLLNEATTWGMSRAAAAKIVTDLLARLPDAVEQAALETPGAPPEALEIVAAQLDRLQPG